MFTIGRRGGGLEIPAQVVAQSHASGRVARHRVDAAVARAGAGGHHRPRLGGQVVDPPVHGQRLPRGGVVAERGPVAVTLDDVLVGDRALDDEDERLQFACRRGPERSQELLAAHRRGQHLVVQVDLGEPGDEAEHDVLDGGLIRRGDRHRVAVAAHALRDPQDVHLRDGAALGRHRGLGLGVAAVRDAYAVNLARNRSGRRSRSVAAGAVDVGEDDALPTLRDLVRRAERLDGRRRCLLIDLCARMRHPGLLLRTVAP